MKQSFTYSFKVWFTCAIVPPLLNIFFNALLHTSYSARISYGFMGLGVSFLAVLLTSSVVNTLQVPMQIKKLILLVIGALAVDVVFYAWKGSAMFSDISITSLWICYLLIIEASLYCYRLKSWAI